MSRRTPLTLLLAPALALTLALLGACGGDDGDDDAAESTTTTTEATTTPSEPADTDDEEPAGTTSDPSEPSTPTTAEPPSTDTTVPPSAPDEPGGPAPTCLSRQVAIAIVQAQSVLFADATVADLSCEGDWAVAGLVVDGAPAGFAYFRHVGGDWSLGYATDSLEDGCLYAVDQDAPAPVLADCP